MKGARHTTHFSPLLLTHYRRPTDRQTDVRLPRTLGGENRATLTGWLMNEWVYRTTDKTIMRLIIAPTRAEKTTLAARHTHIHPLFSISLICLRIVCRRFLSVGA